MPTFFSATRSFSRWVLLALTLITVAVLLALLEPGQWYKRATFWVEHQVPQKPRPAPVVLETFRLVHSQTISVILNNLSGLTFDHDRKHLWAVTNNPPELFALSSRGDVIGRYPLEGYQDTEALAWLAAGRVAIVEERISSLSIIDIPPLPGTVHRDTAHTLDLGLGSLTGTENNGLEGTAYDLKGDRLFLAKEQEPKGLYSVNGLVTSLDSRRISIDIDSHREWIDDEVFSHDLTSLSFDADSGHLVLLSDESQMLLELSEDGEVLAIHSLSAGYAGLTEDIPQAEGLSFDEAGNLYIVSEPNLFYVFSRK